MPLGELLNLDVAALRHRCCEIHPMSVQCRRFEAMPLDSETSVTAQVTPNHYMVDQLFGRVAIVAHSTLQFSVSHRTPSP